MNIKKEKGITGIDIILSVILITIFIGVLATLSYNIQSNLEETKKNAEALYYAINSIETAKDVEFNKIVENKILELEDGYIDNKPYYRETKIIDYSELPGKNTLEKDVAKQVTVTISYRYKNEDKKIVLSTVITKN